MRRARRRSREEWREIIDRWRASGLTGPAFARREKLNFNTFAWWRNEVNREQSSRPSLRERSCGLSLVPVRLPPRVNREPVEVVLPGGITVRVPESAELDRVAALTNAILNR